MAPITIWPILASGLTQLLVVLLAVVPPAQPATANATTNATTNATAYATANATASQRAGDTASETAAAIPTLLSQRAQDWPQWSLPAPLEPPGQRDLIYPAWFAGTWHVHSDIPDYTVRFEANPSGAIVGDRAFNAQAIGTALLGSQLVGVRNDPGNPNRQLAKLTPQPGLNLTLESTVVGRHQHQPSGTSFEADELALQVLHGPGDPRISRVETLSRYELQANGHIAAEQWQATYPSPAQGLLAAATNAQHYVLVLEPISPKPPRPGSDPSS